MTWLMFEKEKGEIEERRIKEIQNRKR